MTYSTLNQVSLTYLIAANDDCSQAEKRSNNNDITKKKN